MTPEEACKRIHLELERLPIFKRPEDVFFQNGLYFFYQLHEANQHSSGLRIVRIGNHPRSQNGLVPRLKNHFYGTKNGSVFRKFIGGALIRRKDPQSPCLEPGPGKGHWEKQDAKTCPKCKPEEKEVSEALKNDFLFRCVRIDDINERNIFERLLISTVAKCRVCIPSSGWLGRWAYSQKVRESGLWNSEYVEDVDIISQSMLERFLELLSQSGGNEKFSEKAIMKGSFNKETGEVKKGMRRPKAEDFEKELGNILSESKEKGNPYVDIEARDLHKKVGGYPGKNHAMPTCCKIMLKAMKSGDQILHQSPSGFSASLKIRYYLERSPKVDGENRVPLRRARASHFHMTEVLILFPCSGKKKDMADTSPSKGVLDFIRDAKSHLEDGRKSMKWSLKPESCLIPAIDRYDGSMYKVNGFRGAIKGALENGVKFLILSGAYGVVLPLEPIRSYNQPMKASYWRKHKLPMVIEEYISSRNATYVYCFFGRTTDYMKIIEYVDWKKLKEHKGLKEAKTYFVKPTGEGGALKKVPETLGKLLVKFIDSGLVIPSDLSSFNGQTIDCLDHLK